MVSSASACLVLIKRLKWEYQSYQVEDFVLDPDFRNRSLALNRESNLFWVIISANSKAIPGYRLPATATDSRSQLGW